MPQFHIVKIVPGREPEICLQEDGQPFVFEDGKRAALNAEAWSLLSDIKHQPRPIKPNGDWRTREQSRLDGGTYKPLPWANEPWFKRESTKDHFAHVGVKDESKLAYTETEAKGAADVQTQIKPGRYLRAYYSDTLNDDAITHWATTYAAMYGGAELSFAKTADEIEHVYLNGPDSCMSHDPDDYSSPYLPVRVYAGFDLAVAYCTDEDGRIQARALCWPERKRYGRVYGDDYRLKELLGREGFEPGSLEGARFTRDTGGSWGSIVCPYIDRYGRVTDCGSHLEIGDTGNGTCYQAESTEGFVEDEIDERSCCDCCEERTDDDELVWIRDRDHQWCEHCVSHHGYTCEATGHSYAYESSVVTLADGTVWSQSYFEGHGSVCEDCDDALRDSDISFDEDRVPRCEPCHDAHIEAQRAEDDAPRPTSPRIEHPDQLELEIPAANQRAA
jgi:hypothetical protein